MLIHDQAGNGTLIVAETDRFQEMRWELSRLLLDTPPFNAGKWQQLDVSESDLHATYELLNVSVWYDMPKTKGDALGFIRPDMPWAEGHFQERVAGKAVNPGDWHDKWPYHSGRVELHQHGGKYDHNYMERFWAKDVESSFSESGTFYGYRFQVGDLEDVVHQLVDNPGTRQAYLPIFFPEDTGATQGQRVPCTLGYHFIIRDGQLHVQYNMRSCEIYRHFTNDVYMATRLGHWMAQKVNNYLSLGIGDGVEPGQLTLNIVSLHGFVGDRHNIEGFQNPARNCGNIS
jgi:hypothetical protein